MGGEGVNPSYIGGKFIGVNPSYIRGNKFVANLPLTKGSGGGRVNSLY